MIRTVKHLLFMNTGQTHFFKDFVEREKGQLVFLQLFHTGQADFSPKSFLFHRPCHIINCALSLTIHMWFIRNR